MATPVIRQAKDLRTILGVGFTLISAQDLLDAILLWRRAGQREMIAFVPPHSVRLARQDPKMSQALDRAALVMPDGIGVILAARILGYDHQGRVCGPDVLPQVCDRGRAHGLRHFFYGGAVGVADRLTARLTARYPGLEVVGTYSPPFRDMTSQEDQRIVDHINAARPDVVWVGLGAPKQERWMLDHLGRIGATVLLGVGAAFDFHSGVARRAPRLLQNMGLEWFWRLAADPGRMWGRYRHNPRFLLDVLAQRLRASPPR